MSKNSEKKAAEAKKAQELKDALSAPVVDEVLVSDQPKNLLDAFMNQDEKDIIAAGEKIQDEIMDLAQGKIDIDEAEQKASDIIKDIKPEAVESVKQKLNDVPKKYWKFQTV